MVWRGRGLCKPTAVGRKLTATCTGSNETRGDVILVPTVAARASYGFPRIFRPSVGIQPFFASMGQGCGRPFREKGQDKASPETQSCKSWLRSLGDWLPSTLDPLAQMLREPGGVSTGYSIATSARLRADPHRARSTPAALRCWADPDGAF
jgi:hypothetical protein